MTPPDIYPITYAPGPDGFDVYAKGVGGVGVPGSGVGFYSPGSGFADAFRKTRAPNPRELLEENLNTAFACGRINGEGVATNPLKLYTQTRAGVPQDRERQRRAREWGIVKAVGRKHQRYLKNSPILAGLLVGADEIEEVTQHPLLELLDNRPDDPTSPWLPRYDLIFLMVQYLDLVGWGYLYVPLTGTGNTPGERWLIPPHMMREVINPDTGLLLYYEFTGGGKPVQLAAQDVIAFRDPDPSNPYRLGRSCLRAGIEKVRISRKMDASINALLDNGGWPGGIYSPKGDTEGTPLGENEAERIRVAFKQAFNRAGRGGLLVTDTPGSFESIQIPPRDMADLEQAQLTKTDIANLFSVPNAKLERNDANRASAETADYAHAKDAILPRCLRLEEAFNQLARRYDPSGRLFVAFDNPVREDRQHDLEERKAMIAVGAVLPNEWRADVGMPDLPGGDVRLATAAVTALGPDGKPVEQPKPPQDAPAAPKPGGGGKNTKAMADAAKSLAQAARAIRAIMGASQRKEAHAVRDIPEQQAIDPGAAKAGVHAERDESPAQERDNSVGDATSATSPLPDVRDEVAADDVTLLLAKYLATATAPIPTQQPDECVDAQDRQDEPVLLAGDTGPSAGDIVPELPLQPPVEDQSMGEGVDDGDGPRAEPL